MRFCQAKKILTELIHAGGKRFDEAVDDGELLLEVHLLINCRS